VKLASRGGDGGLCSKGQKGFKPYEPLIRRALMHITMRSAFTSRALPLTVSEAGLKSTGKRRAAAWSFSGGKLIKKGATAARN
jgi:hypothetical protein